MKLPLLSNWAEMQSKRPPPPHSLQFFYLFYFILLEILNQDLQKQNK
jgi:hypothetical protein